MIQLVLGLLFVVSLPVTISLAQEYSQNNQSNGTKSELVEQKLSDGKSRCEPQSFDTNTNYANVLPQDCGISIATSPDQQIDTDVFEFPWIAILRYDTQQSTRNVTCLGTLIHKRYVLTSLVCASNIDNGLPPFQVRLGEHTVGQSRDYGIECITHHPTGLLYKDFAIDGKSLHGFMSNSISLIRLDRDVIFEDHIRPVCLPVTKTLRNLAPSSFVLVGAAMPLQSSSTSNLAKVIVSRWETALHQEFQQVSNLSTEGLLLLNATNGYIVSPSSLGNPLGCRADYNGERFVQFGFTQVLSGGEPLFFAISTEYHMDWILANIHL